MNDKDFEMWLDSLDFHGTYSQREKGKIIRGVYDKFHPTADELIEAETYLRNAQKWLPVQSELHDAFMDIRRNIKGGGGKPYTPCNQCSPKAPGVLWLRRSHPSKDCMVIGCGCANTPSNMQTLTEIVKSRDDYSVGHFENCDGKYPYENDQDFKARRSLETKESRDRLTLDGINPLDTVGKEIERREV